MKWIEQNGHSKVHEIPYPLRSHQPHLGAQIGFHTLFGEREASIYLLILIPIVCSSGSQSLVEEEKEKKEEEEALRDPLSLSHFYIYLYP